MPDKSFEHAVRFFEAKIPDGTSVWFPLVTVTLVQPTGNRVALPLMFDTGASVTTLQHHLYPLLGVPSWDSGSPVDSLTAGSDAPVRVYRYEGIALEFLGKTVECPVHLARMPAHPLWLGLFGRAQMFDAFGFGFWESAHELYATANP